MIEGFTFDTGVLIALERRNQRARELVAFARHTKVRLTVPSAVVAEWWRGRSDHRDRILGAARVEPLSETTAKLAGEALASVRGATAVDAIVMASAALRGDVVYTTDLDDLSRLTSFFRGVRVLAVG